MHQSHTITGDKIKARFFSMGYDTIGVDAVEYGN